MKSAPENPPEPTVSSDSPAVPPGESLRAKRRRWGRWVIGFLIVAIAALWAAREPIAARIEKIAIRELNRQGVYPRYASRSWLPWRGLRFDHAVLYRDVAGTQPVIEVSAFAVSFPWFEIMRERGLVMRWHTRNATITVHDNSGVLAFQHFTTKVTMHGGALDARVLQFRHEALSFATSGKIMLPAAPAAPPPENGNFSVDLSWFRDAVAAIGVKPGSGPLFIQGTFSVDLREPQVRWQAALQGNGKDLVSHGVPLRSAIVSGELSDTSLKLASTLQFPQGSARLAASRADWDRAPLVVSGHIVDARGATDQVAASFDSAGPSMTISSLSGNAELLTFLQNFPFLVPYLPAGLRVLRTPTILVKDLTWTGNGDVHGFSRGIVQVQSPADILIEAGGEPLNVSGLKGEASLRDKTWQIKASSGRASYRGLNIPNGTWEAEVAWPKAKLLSRLTLAKGSCNMTFSTDNWPRTPLVFNGDVSDSAGRTDRLSGRFDADRRTLTINQLGGRSNLVEFLANFPRAQAVLPKQLEIRTFPELVVKNLSYQVDKKSENWSVESLQLTSGADLTATINGRALPINQLKGTGSFNGRAWRLSDVSAEIFGGRVAVAGTYEQGALRDGTLNLADLQMKQLHAWFKDSEGALDEALITLNYRGAIGMEPAQLTGSGTLRLENAPFVKVPLLDQTYSLFLALTPLGQRADVGRLDATFAASKGVISVSQLSAEGGSIAVSATGTVDLVQRKVSGQAKGNLRGVVGLATSPLASVLEMEVSGPLDQIRVRPKGAVGVVSRGVTGAAKAAGDVIRDGVTLPLRVLDWFKKDPAATPKPK